MTTVNSSITYNKVRSVAVHVACSSLVETGHEALQQLALTYSCTSIEIGMCAMLIN